jgi:putative transposase
MGTVSCSHVLIDGPPQRGSALKETKPGSLHGKPLSRKIRRRSFRYELDPNNRQRTLLAKHAGCARFAYNWGLEQRIRRFHSKTGKARFPSAFDQHRELNRLKRVHFPWMYEVSKCAPQEALRDLERAFKNFWCGRKTGEDIGFPKYKKKGRHDSFRLTGTIHVFAKTIQLPCLGRLRLKEAPRIQGRILSATVTRKVNRWFVSFALEETRPIPSIVSGPIIGVDLGIHNLATLSDGTKLRNPRPLKRKLRKLRRLSRTFNRCQQNSCNRRKILHRLAKLHWCIANTRIDTLHKLTTYLAKNHSRIGIEGLYVKGMLQNRRLSREVADVGFSLFLRQLEYKTEWYGSQLVVAPRFFPSSKRCSRCGYIKPSLSLRERVFHCGNCGLVIDRDLNASYNLEWVAASSAGTINACLETGRNSPLKGVLPVNDAGTEHHHLCMTGKFRRTEAHSPGNFLLPSL